MRETSHKHSLSFLSSIFLSSYSIYTVGLAGQSIFKACQMMRISLARNWFIAEFFPLCVC